MAGRGALPGWARPGAGRAAHAAATAALYLAGGVSSPPSLIAQQASQSDGEVEGRWEGSVLIAGTELPFSVIFEPVDGGLSATMDIPSQGAFGLALTEVSFEDGRVHFELQASIGLAVWDGLHGGETIEGDFTQGGRAGTFTIGRAAAESDAAAEEPVPYREDEISFENVEIHFEGTLTLPEGAGPFPAAVMITGSGPQNRDEELLGFRLFRVIADHLTRRGVAVYRYDDRGMGGSTGSVAQSTTADFAGDVLAAVGRIAEHPDVDAGRVGLIGHSEGGVVAPLAASMSDAIAFTVLLAGTSVPGSEIIYEQSALVARAAGAEEGDIVWTTDFQRRLFAAMEAGEDLQPYRDELEAVMRENIAELGEEQRRGIADVDEFVAAQLQQQIGQLQTPWFRYFLTYDPAEALRGTHVPVLALFGALDLQVPPDQNRGPMAEALSGNPDVTIEVLAGANHLFQAATTGSPMEYGSLEKAFVDGFLDKISDWILARFGD